MFSFIKFKFIAIHPVFNCKATLLHVFNSRKGRITLDWNSGIQFGIICEKMVVDRKVMDQFRELLSIERKEHWTQH